MYKIIKKAAEAFEYKAPKESVTGIKISTISVIFVFFGFAIAYWVNPSIGKPIVFIAIITNFYGLALFIYGILKKNKKYKDELKTISSNSKQPWE